MPIPMRRSFAHWCGGGAHTRWRSGGVVLMLLIVAQHPARVAPTSAAANQVAGETFRGSLLDQARHRIDVWYRDPNNVLPPKEQDGVSFHISKDDKLCGSDAVPVTFVEYDVPNARPVDVFNVLVDSSRQPEWDTSVERMTPLGDFREKQARGFAGVFPAKPLQSREAYEWQVLSANFTEEMFWVILTTLDNEQLEQREPVEQGAITMENCMCAYKIFRDKKGTTHVVNTQQVNSHPWPISSRSAVDLAWTTMVSFAAEVRSQAQKQAKLGWAANSSLAPSWMLRDAGCSATEPETDLKDSLLARAAIELSRSEASRGELLPTRTLASGQQLQLWRRDGAACAGADVPLFRVEFRLTTVAPEEVFQVLAAKAREASWNKNLHRAEVFPELANGARGVHEQYKQPFKVPFLSSARELWEFQVAERFPDNGSIRLVLASMSKAKSPKFEEGDVEATQCLSAYELRPLALPRPGGGVSGTLVQMTSHFNPNTYSVLRHFRSLWNQVAEDMLVAFAEDLASEAARLAKVRSSGGTHLLDVVDGQVLWLIAPSNPDCNQTVTIAELVQSGVDAQRSRSPEHIEGWLERFAFLCVPLALNTSSWTRGSFVEQANSLHSLLALLSSNATVRENATIHHVARDAIEVQIQGQVLAALQNRVREYLAVVDCAGGGALPDINRDGDAGMPLWQTIVLAVLVLVTVFVVGVGVCCWVCRRRRLQRSMASRSATATAPPLLAMAGSEGPDDTPVVHNASRDAP